MTPIWSTTNGAWKLVASRRAWPSWPWPWSDHEKEDELNVGEPVDVFDAVGDAVNRVVFGALANARQAAFQFTTTTFSLITYDGLPLLSPRADYTNVVDGRHPAWYALNSRTEPKALAGCKNTTRGP